MLFDKKARSGVNANEQLAEELHKPSIKKNSREEKCVGDLKTIFRQWN